MENKNIIFIHINKCGGTSIKSVISKYPHIIVPNNDSLIELRQYSIWDESNKVTVVRNPYDRLLSLYFMLKRDKFNYSIEDILDIVFNENIKFKVKDGGLNRGSVEYVKRHGQPITHNHYSIYNPEKNKLRVNKVFKLENLNDEYEDFKKYFRIRDGMPRLNKSKNNSDYTMLNQSQIDKINKYYHLDFEKFSYYKI